MEQRKQKWKPGIDTIRPGTIIKGKWYRQNYPITKKIGSGAVGTVFLCEANGKQAALKISDNGAQVTTEVNVLKSLQKVQGRRLGPYLLDVDDWIGPGGRSFSFYVMEYLKGEPLLSFMQRGGQAWIGVFLLQLLEDLEGLHQSGWVFGDLKSENLIVVSSPPRVRWVDVGGTTQMGRSIKEYTEFYDRGYWGMGTRKAEASYDLFALTMVVLEICYPKRFKKDGNSAEALLFKKINHAVALAPYSSALKKALIGRYSSSTEMKQDIKKALYSRQKQRSRRSKAKKTSKPSARSIKNAALEISSIGIFAAGYYILSLFI